MTKKRGRCGYISRKPFGCECHKGKRVRCVKRAGHSRSKDCLVRVHWVGNHFYILDNARKVRISFDA